MLYFHTQQNAANTHGDMQLRMAESLIPGVNFRVWDVTAQSIEYEHPQALTLSLYLKGGQGTYRRDKPSLKGGPGKLCLMPQGHISRWHSGEKIRIAHLYLPEKMLLCEAERHLDIDARLANLPELVFKSDNKLSQAMQGFIQSNLDQQTIDPLFAEQGLHTIIVRLLEGYCPNTLSPEPLKGGLSYAHKRSIKTLINASIHTKLTLEDLAAHLHLSPFHFARLFKQSFGDSPANYIIRQRVHLAKRLLATQRELAQISQECGFSHQSHFSNYFKKRVGVTPRLYRQLLNH